MLYELNIFIREQFLISTSTRTQEVEHSNFYPMASANKSGRFSFSSVRILSILFSKALARPVTAGKYAKICVRITHFIRKTFWTGTPEQGLDVPWWVSWGRSWSECIPLIPGKPVGKDWHLVEGISQVNDFNEQ